MNHLIIHNSSPYKSIAITLPSQNRAKHCANPPQRASRMYSARIYISPALSCFDSFHQPVSPAMTPDNTTAITAIASTPVNYPRFQSTSHPTTDPSFFSAASSNTLLSHMQASSYHWWNMCVSHKIHSFFPLAIIDTAIGTLYYTALVLVYIKIYQVYIKMLCSRLGYHKAA